MHLRRALLLFALVLGVSALIASFAAPPGREPANRKDAGSEQPTAGPGTRAPSARTVRLRFGPSRGSTRSRTVPPGAHVILTVAVEHAAQVAVRGTGQLETAGPHTPALFDLLLPREGRYEVVVEPAEGRLRKAGTLIVKR
jgi:hypothetical protein